MAKTKSLSKTVLMTVLSILVVLAMMPASVFADTVIIDGEEYESTISVKAPGVIYAGTQKTLTATSQTDYEDTYHVDWTIEDTLNQNTTGVATINKHQGVLTATQAGTIVVTATLRTGSAGSGNGSGNGSGGGSGSSCTGTALATTNYTVTISESAIYGYQGTGGNTMQMTGVNGVSGSSLAISAGVEKDSNNNVTGYNNEITLPTSLPAGQTLSFTFKMSAGTNNFKPATFNSYSQPAIAIYKVGETTASSAIDQVTTANFNSSTKEITIYSSSTLSAGTYKIVFGSAVCGNNTSKNLGVPVSFQFNVAAAQ